MTLRRLTEIAFLACGLLRASETIPECFGTASRKASCCDTVESNLREALTRWAEVLYERMRLNRSILVVTQTGLGLE